MIVQPNNINIADERPIEYGLWDSSPSIPCYRLIFGATVLASCTLSPSGTLLYQNPSIPASSPVEISVVYLRAGYDLQEFDDTGHACRLLLEKSRAIKCPSLLCHLTTWKKVQQALTVPGVLKRWLSDEEAEMVEKTFAPMWPMDGRSEEGRKGRHLALNPQTAVKHVLKPSLEGGGHNVYGAAIPALLKKIGETEWGKYVLMELIESPVNNNVLSTPRGLYSGEVISELGIFGVCLWESGAEKTGKGNILVNEAAGWSFKTKPRDVEEMSVVKGFGAFDSPDLRGKVG